jgi:hypothetical protein
VLVCPPLIVSRTEIYDGGGSFAAGQLEDERPMPDGWSISVQPEHPYSAGW